MINLLWSGLLMVLVLSGCGWNGTPTRTNDFIPLTSIEIVPVYSTIAKGTSTTLSVKGNFSGLFTRDITDQVTWSSSSTAVADFITTASPIRVKGITPGSAILTATVKGVSGTFALTVSNATIQSMTITPAAPTIAKGFNNQFAVNGTFSDSTTQDLTFDATWASSTPAVATVSDAADSKGFAQALTIGTSTISATFAGVSGTTLLTVTESVLQSITITPADPSFLILSTGSLQALGHYSDGTTLDITGQAVWTSSLPDIATIASGGAVATLTVGTTTITAALNGVNGTTKLNVTGGNLNRITVSTRPDPVVKGNAIRISATGTFSNGASRDITKLVSWSVADPAIASVTKPGGNLAWLNALALTQPATPTTIAATFGTLTSDSTNLTVISPVPASLSIVAVPTTTSLTNLPAGISIRFIATAQYGDGTIQEVTASSACTWISGISAIATVDNSTELARGRVRLVSAGTTTISASYVGEGGVTVTAPSVTITVPQPLITLTSLQISPPPTSAVPGNQTAFTAAAVYSDGSTRDVTEDPTTTWSIDSASVAIPADSANQPGQVVWVGSGTTIISASFGGLTATRSVTVLQ